MVKGVSRRVIVVKNPDPEVFEQAIFIVREDFLHDSGATPERILREAGRAADRYLADAAGKRPPLREKLAAPAFAAAGAAAAGIAWLALRLAGMG